MSSVSFSFFRRHLLKIVLFLSLCFGVSFGIFYFLLQVQNVELDTSDTMVNIRVGSMLQILEYVKKTNIILLKTDSLETHFLKKFKELSSISIEKKYPNTLYVEVISHPIIAKWEYIYGPTEEKHEGYINKNHIFVEHNSSGDSLDAVLSIIDIQPRKEKIEFYDELPEGVYISKIVNAKTRLEEVIQREIVTVNYYRDAEEIYLIDDKGVAYWLYLQKDLNDQIQKLEYMLKEKNILKWRLNYIDLRINEKVIYTFD